jgi:hypothetical protein
MGNFETAFNSTILTENRRNHYEMPQSARRIATFPSQNSSRLARPFFTLLHSSFHSHLARE